MKIPFIDWVKTNIKCGADAKLGPKTIIVGANGTGKSTIVDALQLALTGSVDAVAFKDSVKQEVALMALKNHESDDEEPLLAEATCHLPDGSSLGARWSASGSRESARTAEWKNSIPASKRGSMILGSLRSTLATAGVDRLREMFIAAVEDSVKYSNVEVLLSGEAKDFFETCGQTTNHASAMELLSRSLEQADKEKRAASQAIKTLEASQSSHTGKIPSDKDVEAATESLKKAEAGYETAVKVLGKAEVVRELKVPTKVHPTTAALATVLDAVKEKFDGAEQMTCPLCMNEVPASTIDDRHAKIHAMIESAEAKFESASKPIQKTDAEKKASEELSLAKAALGDARSKLSSLITLKDEYDAQDQNRASLEKAKVDVDRFKRIHESLKAARDSLIQSGAVELEKKVQSFLPSSFKFRLVLNYGDRRVCLLGFERGNSIDIALSAGESCLLLIALASALAEEPEQCLHVAVPPDCSMSPATLISLMEATVNAPVQIIICTTTDPGKVPNGWTRIRTPL